MVTPTYDKTPGYYSDSEVIYLQFDNRPRSATNLYSVPNGFREMLKYVKYTGPKYTIYRNSNQTLKFEFGIWKN